ncbi:MAG: SDR family oxidoreductase [Rhodospirillaceae bacterium]|jgi:NAD(P)-dependent dehydrogenase (short-subunit alcohol dehydrogenase family)|nr:SDR family oxidoreductase [Rhodospirillaceae bacterium]MBT3495298.1 SDR family oxidoreductase [Rhodospirillaceae bacterium]MBT3781941.1 SDR family oxidoreductase [Rhodospirillaceae bacterium]MBT3979641.1 SDR family oxidoreductase [Rhodospirillaceae bacterium]MBT4167984.1 SDR family oxidoreductase [Rhodospirillaceae bacterium]
MSGERRTAIVTGAANGIGRATALRLAKTGFDLCLVDKDGEALRQVAKSIAEAGGSVIVEMADVMQRSEVEGFAEAALKKYGRIDALANIAGGAGPKSMHQIDEISDADWDLVINLNLRSTYWACQAVIPAMRAQSHGRIVNMSSTAAHGRIGPVGTAGARLVYATAKAGILGFTHQLAKDVAEFGITVNAVLPWLILSEPGSRIRNRFEALEPAGREQILNLSPMHRAGEADEVAAAIEFLFSEQAGYISGVELPIDGAYLVG